VIPGDGEAALVVGLVAGDEADRGGVVAVGDGDAGGLGGGDSGADAGDELKVDAVGAQVLGLFAAAAEDHGIAALEADDVATRERVLDHEIVDGGLIEEGGVGAGLALVDPRLRAAVHEVRGVDEVVGDHDVGAAEALAPGEGEQLGIPRARADERDKTSHAGEGSGSGAGAVQAAGRQGMVCGACERRR
jgi:hypothetical protein